MSAMKEEFAKLHPWSQILVLNGWDPTPYLAALDRGDWQGVALAHPFNFADEHTVQVFAEAIYADLEADNLTKPMCLKGGE